MSLGTIRLLRPRGWFAGGVQFSKRLKFFFSGGGGGGGNFLNDQNVRGVEILRHRTGLLCKVVTTYHPAALDLKKTLMVKWSLIQNQPLLKTIFRIPPIISYKRGKSLKDMLLRAKM